MKLETLHDLYMHEMRDLHSAEQQFGQAVASITEAAISPELTGNLERLQGLCSDNLHHLERLFADMDVQLGGVSCQGMAGLVDEGRWFWQADGEPHVRDAGLIGAVQRMLHYLIAAYGCARTFAQLLEHDRAVDTLQGCLDRENEADRTLTRLARESINVEAASA